MTIGYVHPDYDTEVWIDGDSKAACQTKLRVLCRRRGWKLTGWKEVNQGGGEA